jgi:hypothetical protein
LAVSAAFVIDNIHMERTASGSVVAGIWLQFETGTFPAEGWDDFATKVLVSFAEATARLASDASDFELVSFMDGPKRVLLQRSIQDRLRLQTISEDRRPAVIENDEDVEREAFAQSIISEGSRLLGWCEERGWLGRDEASLKHHLEELRNDLLSRHG